MACNLTTNISGVDYGHPIWITSAPTLLRNPRTMYLKSLRRWLGHYNANIINGSVVGGLNDEGSHKNIKNLIYYFQSPALTNTD